MHQATGKYIYGRRRGRGVTLTAGAEPDILLATIYKIHGTARTQINITYSVTAWGTDQ